MEHTKGRTEGHGADGLASSRMHLRTGEMEAGESEQPHIVDALRSRASEVAGRARDLVGSTFSDARDLVEERTNIVAFSREHPMVALGAALSTGFILASILPASERHWLVERGRRQLQALIVSGLAALVAREVRALREGDDGYESTFEWPDAEEPLDF